MSDPIDLRLPWTFKQCPNLVIFDADGDEVLLLKTSVQWPEGKAIRDFVLTAVNSHAALVEALRGVIAGRVCRHSNAIHPSGLLCHHCGMNSKVLVHAPGCSVETAEEALKAAGEVVG